MSPDSDNHDERDRAAGDEAPVSGSDRQDQPSADDPQEGGSPGGTDDERETSDRGETEPATIDAASDGARESSTEPGERTDEDRETTGSEDGTGTATSGTGDGATATESAETIGIQEVERVFTVLEEALENDALSGAQFDRLLTVLEEGVATPAETSPEEVAEFVSLLEELVVEPEEIEETDIDGLLSVFEEALTGTDQGGLDGTNDVVATLTEAMRDPTRVDPEDVERFSSGIEQTIQSVTGSQDLGRLFGFAPPERADQTPDDDQVDAFRLARLAAGMTQRASGYSVESGVRTGTRMAYAAANAQSPADLLTNTRAIALDELQHAGIDIGEDREDWLQRHESETTDRRPVTRERLRQRGEKLLSESAELGRGETFHPAYSNILSELTGDEARILRLLATEGPQPAIDVYDRELIPFNATLVATNLSRIGSDAGCRSPERTQVSITNLERLGLIRFGEDPVEDLKAYQVLEAQPHIEAAQDEAKRPKTVYRQISLTDFGIDFCETCLPVSVEGQKSTERFWDNS